MLPSQTFVLGGAASGKSVVAENLIVNSGLRAIYLATSQTGDDEMADKIARHRARRGDMWQTIEAPHDIGPALRQAGGADAVLLDCATMWLSNVMLADRDIDTEQERLLDALSACAASVVVVSNEVGQGIVPENALARRFREAQGRLNIALAARADCVLHVVAGLPNVLKGRMP